MAGEGLFGQFFVDNSAYSEDFPKWFFFLAYLFQYASFDVYIAIFGEKNILALEGGR